MTKPALFRDPADWARDWGWVSRRRALRAAARLRDLADRIDGAIGAEEPSGVHGWSKELRAVATYIAPAKVPAERKHEKLEAAKWLTEHLP